MKRLHVYAGAIAVIGLSFGVDSTLSLAAGKSSLPLWLMAVGGDGMVLAAVYEVMTTDPADFRISTYRLGGMLFGTILVLAPFIIGFVA